jgi:hypothetical protein
MHVQSTPQDEELVDDWKGKLNEYSGHLQQTQKCQSVARLPQCWRITLPGMTVRFVKLETSK